jgi:uncharacterized cupredoxin-like copper-binding protein
VKGPMLTTAAIVAAAFAVGSTTGAAQPAAPAATTVVNVSMYEMGFKLSKRIVPRGTVLFRVVNSGEVEHDFRITGKGTSMLDAGERATLKVVFKKRGKFSFLCTVEGHAVAGMIGKLTVR